MQVLGSHPQGQATPQTHLTTAPRRAASWPKSCWASQSIPDWWQAPLHTAAMLLAEAIMAFRSHRGTLALLSPTTANAGSGLPSSRPAYSPDAFDDSSKKGSKLAQKLLGKSTNTRLVASPIAYGSHVAGRSHKQWSDSLNSTGTGHAGAAEVQQV